MSTWSGWEKQFLNAASVPNTKDNRAVLGAWASHANASCTNNPIDLSHVTVDSTPCALLTDKRTSQNYKSHAKAAAAFGAELRSGSFPSLLGAFRSGAPEAVGDVMAVYNDLRTWGSTVYSNYYLEHVTGGTASSGGSSGTIDLPAGFKGWKDLSHRLGHDLPTSLRRSSVIRQAALRRLHAPRRLG